MTEATAVATGDWTEAGRLPLAGEWQAVAENAVLLADGRVLIAGGEDTHLATFRQCTVFEPATGKWSQTGELGIARGCHSTTRLADGSVLAAGGTSGSAPFPSQGSDTAERYDPVAGTWAPAGTMTAGRWSHSATLLGDGRVLVAGGQGVRSPGNGTTLSSAEIYDPVAKTWTATGPMTDRRSGHQAVLLPDGRVLVIGGIATTGGGEYTGLAFCELFDPATGAWTPTGTLARPRWNNTATVLTDGTVLVTGGGWPGMVNDWVFNSGADWTTERYDPASGQWTADADLSSARTWHQAVLLRSGKVLVFGGANAPSLTAGFRSAEIYDPLTRSWTAAAGLRTGRWAAVAVLLADGRVLTAGGVEYVDRGNTIYQDTLTTTTEIFTPPEDGR
ncbi:N-acetylneuraminic acid mutarotase [Amycolatopsis xylanica]|uniref:N-acetylneuraminic acid mutarotase n=1 Tax=Amycolatopsis xylanica TaxID=589385 RepID=A0A1H3RDI9_9PSEU|nr:kelch repeat-containing protein [Amycolatopsis xylanica]SDZ23747.1 N-acetylneuraminic acid mutarotase [Amycolatopsis xylanica]